MWFKRKKTNGVDRKLTRSDFILWKIRELNGAQCELYTKWHMGGAFNGAALSRTHDYVGHFMNVCFFHEEPKPWIQNDARLLVQLPQIHVVVSCDSTDLHSGTEDLIIEADQTVSSRIKRCPSQLVSKVKRLQISLGYKSNEKEHELTGKSLIEFLFAPFTGSISTTSSVHYPIPLPAMADTWEIDGEIFLENVESEATVINLLKPLLPEIESSIFGFGFVSRKCARRELSWIHLTGRHF